MKVLLSRIYNAAILLFRRLTVQGQMAKGQMSRVLDTPRRIQTGLKPVIQNPRSNCPGHGQQIISEWPLISQKGFLNYKIIFIFISATSWPLADQW